MITAEVYKEKSVLGACSMALCIPDEKLHATRLSMAAQMLRSSSIGSVLDVGCGFCDLVDHLGEAKTYAGIEVTDWIRQKAKEDRPHLQLFAGEALRVLRAMTGSRYDAVVALGVLSTCLPDEWPLLLSEMSRVSKRVVVLSWNEHGEYRGQFQSYDRNDLEQAMHGRVKALSSALGDSEYTGLWLR